MSTLLGQAAKLAMLAVALSPGSALTADIEKWVDHEGRVHYSDRAPTWAVARPVKVHPNVIETDPVAQPVVTVKRPVFRAPAERPPDPSHRQRAEIRAYIELCRNNRGIDCEREAHAMIDGPATLLFPGDPLIFPRPDLESPSLPPPEVPTALAISPARVRTTTRATGQGSTKQISTGRFSTGQFSLNR